MKGHLTIPSPVSEISTNWISEHNSNILLKRDDLIHPIISGNKWRKLSGILAKNRSSDYDSLITFGGAYSNHLLAVAAVCSILKIRCKAFVRGEAPKTLNAVLKMCKMYGMELAFISRENYQKSNRSRVFLNEHYLFLKEELVATEQKGVKKY